MKTKYKIITSLEEVDILIKSCKYTGYCSYDWETNAQPLYNHDFKTTILSISFMPGFGCSIPTEHPETPKNFKWRKAIDKIGHELMENTEITKVGWNIKFDNQIWELFDIYYRGTAIDGMLAKYILNEEKPNGLKDMVRRYLPEYGDYEKEEAFDKIPWDQKPLQQLCEYGCQDTDYTLRLTLFFEKKIMDLGLYSTFRNLIMTASRVLTSAEKQGLYLDRNFNQKLLEEYKPKIDAAQQAIYDLPKVKKFTKQFNQKKIEKYIASIEKEIEELDPIEDKKKIKSREDKIARIKAGEFTTKKEQELIRPLNLGSPIDLPELLYSEEGFHFPILKKSDKGKPSTDEETLVNLRMTVKNPESAKAIFLDKLQELSGLKKMYTTFIEGWSEKVQDDSRLHGKFNIIGCVSGNTKLVCKEKDIRIKDICPKEIGINDVTKDNLWILSHEGTWEQITHTINKGKQSLYKVTTLTGDILKCTKEHKLLTTKGWKKVDYIYKHNLNVIMYDTSYLDITKPKVGKSSEELIFKEIPGWKGYLASNEGKIYSVKVAGNSGALDYNHPHELIPREWKEGRPRVYFRNRGSKKYAFSVSHLVWMAFNDKYDIPKGMVIDHINCDPRDNRPENLQCITNSENIKRAYKYTRSAYTQGSINGTNKFDTITVGKIIEDYNNGSSQRDICDKYNISQKQVSGILLKQRRKNIYLTKISSLEYQGEYTIYDLSVNDKHSYITRSNFINSNTTSGRLSSSEPNMQQIPKTSVDPNIKKQLVAPKGKLYFASDFSQAELRIMAHLSGDETYLTAFREGQDPHLAIAADKYGVPYEEAVKIYDDESHPDYKTWKYRRKQAKQIAFGLIYGIGAALLAIKLSDPKAGIIVSKEEAQKEMDIFFSKHPKLKKFKEKQEKVLKKNGYLLSLFGRKRRLPQIWSDNREDQAYAIRLALNFPCQSAASDMTLFGSILIYWAMRQGKLPFMEEAATVHDAVYFYAEPNDINLWTIYKMWNIFKNPLTKPYFGFQIDDVTMDMDYSVGRTMAEELPFIPGYDYNQMLSPDFSVEEYMEEAKKYKHIEIKDYKHRFNKQMKAYEKEFKER